ncbi:RNA polymerase I-specific transcription initiation factor rrn7 [Lachnellula arida]|uniref:RNA polymerase I-specific transcription initiation factor rrn7 n=1 Tax=Lachnellula arida TaxID=1316785 RepID=A0A8T9BST6_9HELO|nr:RNA polymerase I-specific transcription initiation factor rrn7 [Lachnellula arida]
MSSYIDYHRFPRGESCTEEGCRSRKYYIEDGKKFCQRGHEQAGFTQTQQDEDDWNQQGRKTRKKKEEKEKVEKVLSGLDASNHYLECFQLILRKQSRWLIEVKGFPPELEIVVRDLWTSRIQDLHKPEERGGYGSTMFSSQSEGENTDTDGARSMSSRRSKGSVVGKEKLPKLIETLGLCYLGMLLLRLPVSLGELYKWAAKEEITYTRAIKEIPKDMRTRLPPYYYAALEIRAQLKGSSLYRTVLQLVEFYNHQFEMVFPPLNAPLLIFKHVRDLGLPVEIYPAVRRLSTMLGFDFSYPTITKRVHEIQAYPEIQIISMIILATKLSHPFDSITRIPESDLDPTALKLDWAKWRKTMGERSSDGLKQGDEIKVTDTDVLGMSEKKMDDYLDWYQRTWIDDRDAKMAEQILELFPLEELPPKPVAEPMQEQSIPRVKQVQQDLISQKPLPLEDDESEKINRPGELYRRYRRVEDLPENARIFYEKAAENTGISLKMLVRGVVQLETLMGNWNLADRKRRLLAEQQSVSSSDDED